MLTQFDLLFASPGLQFLAEQMFSRLDLISFSQLEMVDKNWRTFMVANQLWRKRMLTFVKQSQDLYWQKIAQKEMEKWEENPDQGQ